MQPPLRNRRPSDFLTGKEPVRPGTIDDHDVFLERVIVEQSSAFEREPDGLEELGRNANPGADRLTLAGRRRAILEIEVVVLARLPLGGRLSATAAASTPGTRRQTLHARASRTPPCPCRVA